MCECELANEQWALTKSRALNTPMNNDSKTSVCAAACDFSYIRVLETEVISTNSNTKLICANTCH